MTINVKQNIVHLEFFPSGIVSPIWIIKIYLNILGYSKVMLQISGYDPNIRKKYTLSIRKILNINKPENVDISVSLYKKELLIIAENNGKNQEKIEITLETDEIYNTKTAFKSINGIIEFIKGSINSIIYENYPYIKKHVYFTVKSESKNRLQIKSSIVLPPYFIFYSKGIKNIQSMNLKEKYNKVTLRTYSTILKSAQYNSNKKAYQLKIFFGGIMRLLPITAFNITIKPYVHIFILGIFLKILQNNTLLNLLNLSSAQKTTIDIIIRIFTLLILPKATKDIIYVYPGKRTISFMLFNKLIFYLYISLFSIYITIPAILQSLPVVILLLTYISKTIKILTLYAGLLIISYAIFTIFYSFSPYYDKYLKYFILIPSIIIFLLIIINIFFLHISIFKII